MSKGRLLGSVVIGALLCVWSAQGYAADITIDNFEEGAADMTVNVSTPTAADVDEGLSTTNVIGGQRDSSVTWESGASGNVGFQINAASSGLAQYSSGSGMDGWFGLIYGSSNFLSADLTDGGSNNCFGLLFDVADFEGDINFTVWTGETNSGTASAKTPSGLPSEDPDEWVYINFSAFSGSLNFTDVDKIEIKIDGPSESDYTVKEILSTVPEPSVLALLGFGGLAFLISARRRSRKS